MSVRHDLLVNGSQASPTHLTHLTPSLAALGAAIQSRFLFFQRKTVVECHRPPCMMGLVQLQQFSPVSFFTFFLQPVITSRASTTKYVYLIMWKKDFFWFRFYIFFLTLAVSDFIVALQALQPSAVVLLQLTPNLSLTVFFFLLTFKNNSK